MRHILTLILLLALPLTAAAQSAESDSLYAAGVELYRQGCYREALPLFERAAQLDREQLSEISSQPDHDDEWAAACWHHRGDDVKARKLARYNYELEPLDRRLMTHADSLYESSYLLYMSGQNDAALADLSASIAEMEELFGSGHYSLLDHYEAVAYITMAAGRNDEMMAALQQLQTLTDTYYSETNPARMAAGYILAQAVEQQDAGADILDINVGLPGINEPEMMKSVVKEVRSVTTLPLQIDASDPAAIEAGLRYGKPTLIIPFAGDQPAWAQLVWKAGCGPKPIPRNAISAQRLAEGILALISNPQYAENARALSEKISLEHGVPAAADRIEAEIAAW